MNGTGRKPKTGACTGAMSYRHIENLYKCGDIFLFKECFALEKLHGTSARVSWRGGQIWISSGSANKTRFDALFDKTKLMTVFEEFGYDEVEVYGEAYGGSILKQAWRYGDAMRFGAFEVCIGGIWLAVPQAHDVVGKLGLEFVHYSRIPATVEAVDAERDAPSEQARRNGVEGDRPREGVVLRPIVELRKNDDDRIIVKHKRDEERETSSPRPVAVDPKQLEILSEAAAIAAEWVTPMRLTHVLDKLGGEPDVKMTGQVVRAMVEDVFREATGEIVDSKEARTAVGRRASEMFLERVRGEKD